MRAIIQVAINTWISVTSSSKMALSVEERRSVKGKIFGTIQFVGT